ncbi:MAG TPA: ATP-dependent 6-phosphofructokinase [Actinomycetes bacterium]|jgi:phosphofructokinase-like protein|nr:ATP-dependent 6-phosphofructokinase [Actinomycetes bacterium]
MTAPIRRIGVLTSGGDAPGLNAVIRAVVRSAEVDHGWSVLGIEEGFEGLIGRPRTRTLDSSSVSGLLNRGGTILGSSNKGHFSAMRVDGEWIRDPAPYKELAANTKRLGIDALVVIGGEGSQGIASELSQYGVRAVGVPKTIDNDLWGCDRTFGFDTALTVATEALDRLHTTAASHNRVMVLEVMGRDAGWIALHSGLGGGADVILLPEIPFTVEAVASKVLTREYRGSLFSIVIVAEGAVEQGGGQVYQESTGTLGGIGAHVAAQVGKVTGKDARVVVLGHLQRGGVPTPFDRILATRFGAAAVRVLAEGRYGEVVVSREARITTVSMAETAGKTRTVPPDHEMIQTARGLGIGFGDEEDHDLTPQPLA